VVLQVNKISLKIKGFVLYWAFLMLCESGISAELENGWQLQATKTRTYCTAPAARTATFSIIRASIVPSQKQVF
jgi:hypothetical protein